MLCLIFFHNCSLQSAIKQSVLQLCNNNSFSLVDFHLFEMCYRTVGMPSVEVRVKLASKQCCFSHQTEQKFSGSE